MKKIIHVGLIAGFVVGVVGHLAATEPTNLINMSTLLNMSAKQSFTIGFTASSLTGSTADSPPVKLLVRAVGESLGKFGLSGAPKVEIKLEGDAGKRVILATLATNRKSIEDAGLSVGAFSLLNGSTGDDAILLTAPPGGMTFSITNTGTVGGYIILEAYQLNGAPFGPAAAPTNLIVTKATAAITLQWDKSPDARVNEYSIYRSDNFNSVHPPTRVAQTSGTTFSDFTPASNIRYYYWVTANTADEQESAFSNPASGIQGTGF